MSINKKIMIFAISLVIIPMLILYYFSSHILNKQIDSSAQSYLKNVSKIAQNELINRRLEATKGTEIFVKNDYIINLIKENKKDQIIVELNNFTNTYKYINYLTLLDSDYKIMASIEENISEGIIEELESELKTVKNSKEIISSPMIFNINNVFKSNTEQFEKYIIKSRFNSDFQKVLISIAIVPVIDNENIIGYMLSGHIINNDIIFPKIYSKNVPGSFLAISIDGIRISSNIESPINNDFIGSSIPFESNNLVGPDDFYYGRINIDNEVHVFLDVPIINYSGNLVGILGVGIPEKNFSILLSTNQNLIRLVAIVTFFLIVFIGREISDRITEPIEKVTFWSEQIAKGNKDIDINIDNFSSWESETDILLRTFKKMAEDLKESEEKSKRYLKELEMKHFEQVELTDKLELLNNDLEKKVEARTEDLKQAVMVLKHSDSVKTRFLANMSHELRTPLNGIIATANALNEKIFGEINEKQEKYIKNIILSSNHLLQLINDILDITKIEVGKMTLNISRYSVKDLIEESIEIIKTLAYRKNIEIYKIINPENFIIELDSRKTKQILYNLLSNAVKFTPEGGKVIVEVALLDDFVRFSVKDNGIGIKEEDHEKVFKEFEQVDNSYEREYEGTGLGLSLSKKLVELHGGEMFLISKANVGTEVFFTIPLKKNK